jgi:hypothetical protein
MAQRSPFKPTPRAAETTVIRNTAQVNIEVTEDKVRHAIRDFQEGYSRRKSWLTPFGIMVSLFATLVTTTFTEKYGKPACFWEALCDFAIVACIIWILLNVIPLLWKWRLGSIEYFMCAIKNQPHECLVDRVRLRLVKKFRSGLAPSPDAKSGDDQKGANVATSDALEAVITDSIFRLYFQPPDKSKLIKFEPGGGITDGRNQNEDTWRLNGDKLEILNSQKQVFSRFRYDRRSRTFMHTGDTDTLSEKNQFISHEKET